jgi:hypothetical protein
LSYKIYEGRQNVCRKLHHVFHENVYDVQALAIHGFAIEIIKAEPLLADQSAFCKRLV